MAFKPYESALRERVTGWIRRLGSMDILVGIPCYNNEDTIAYVIEQVGRGLKEHYPGLKTGILVADGGSTDDTRDNAVRAAVPEGVERVIFIYRGLPGKGTSFRSIFEAARLLKSKAVIVLDSDLRSLTPAWIKSLADPILEGKVQFAAPLYCRHKYDGTITNLIVYPMTRALYGKRIRQPIGGDFAFSGRLTEIYLSKDVWMTDVARFGIDIWMTTVAVNEAESVGQVSLGSKIHDPKDPAADLDLMFRQVISTMFFMMSDYEGRWRPIEGSRDVPIFPGPPCDNSMPSIVINEPNLVKEFLEGFQQFGTFYRDILCFEHFEALQKAYRDGSQGLPVPIGAELWAGILYDFAFTFHNWSRNRRRLVNIMSPLYFGRTAAYVEEVKSLSWEEAEEVVLRQAEKFEEKKAYLRTRLSRWEQVT